MAICGASGTEGTELRATDCTSDSGIDESLAELISVEHVVRVGVFPSTFLNHLLSNFCPRFVAGIFSQRDEKLPLEW